MPIGPVDRRALSGSGASEAHAKSLLDKVDEVITELNAVSVGSGSVGWIYCSDLDAVGGSVGDKVWQDDNETVLQSARSSTVNLVIEIRSGYPLVRINGEQHQLERDAGGGFFTGWVEFDLAASGEILLEAISPDGVVGASDTFEVIIDTPPVLLSLSFTGGYPGSQTEVKDGDPFGVQGTADKPIDAIEVIYFYGGAGKAEVIPIAEGTSFSEVITIEDADGLLPARLRARSASTGAWGPTRDTNHDGGTTDGVDLVNCNNTKPSISIGSIVYPGSQQALKDSESATWNHTITDADSVVYSDPSGSQLNIANPSTYEPAKLVTRIGGDYNISVTNLRATAHRVANDATTVRNLTVQIAHADPVISVVEPAARLRSGGNDGTTIQSHTITINSSQRLLSTPSLSADSGGSRGTFIGGWSGGPTSWTRTLQVHDDDEKGIFAWESLSATNLAGKVVTTISGDGSYTLGGFVQRNATFPAFQDLAPINVETVDYSKISFGTISQTNQPAVKQPIGTSPPVVDGMTIVATGVSPTQVRWLDTDQVAANTGAPLAYVPVQEAV